MKGQIAFIRNSPSTCLRVAIGALDPSPPATTTAAMPPANPATPAPPLHLRHEIRWRPGLTQVGGDRHRLRSLNEANADCAHRCGGNGILRKAKESAAGGS